MVVVPIRDSADAWDLIRGGPPDAPETEAFLAAHAIASSHAATSQGPVLIFTAAADPDALAAVRTLTALLKSDLVRYEVHPVPGYKGLRDKFMLLCCGDAPVAPRAVLCVNCGGMVNLESLLSLTDDQYSQHIGDLRIFVMDTHRPYHLTNIRSNRIVLFNDSDEFNHAELPINILLEDKFGNVPDDDDVEEEDADPDESDRSESESDSDLSGFIEDDDPKDPSERDDHPPEEGIAAQEREDYLDAADEDDVVFDEDNPENGDENGLQSRKRSATSSASSPAHKRRRRRRRTQTRRRRVLSRVELEERARLREYYADASMATSTACVSHAIAKLMRRSTEDTLWMAIVGLTAQFITSSIPDNVYETQLAFCREEVETLNPSTSTSTEGEENSARPEDEDSSALVPLCGSSAPNRISKRVELRLDLLRHWSLYDSLLLSTYTATRLTSWRQTGRRRLLELLATLGIPLKESQQQWCYMKLKSKRALEEQLTKAVARFDLGHGLHFKSFVRTLPGHRGDISASDFVHAVTALLEMDNPLQRFASISTGNAGESSNPSTLLLDRFWRAYDALDPKKVRLLEDGLDMAVSAQSLTAEIGGDVIERRKFVPSGPFRYVFLREQQHKELLSQPLLLRRLALFLNTALARQGFKEKPFIVLAPDAARKTWIAVAVTTSTQRNDFGHRFQKAAERNGSNVTFSGFDSSVCEIEDGHEIEFVRFLHDIM